MLIFFFYSFLFPVRHPWKTDLNASVIKSKFRLLCIISWRMTCVEIATKFCISHCAGRRAAKLSFQRQMLRSTIVMFGWTALQRSRQRGTDKCQTAVSEVSSFVASDVLIFSPRHQKCHYRCFDAEFAFASPMVIEHWWTSVEDMNLRRARARARVFTEASFWANTPDLFFALGALSNREMEFLAVINTRGSNNPKGPFGGHL